MSTLPAPAAPPRHGSRPDHQPQPERRAPHTAMLFATGLLAVGVVLALLLAWSGPGGVGHPGRVSPPAGHTRATAGGAAPIGPVVEATEVTATPSRGEPTDVVPFGGSASPVTQQPGTAVPAATAPPTPTATATQSTPVTVAITCADAQNNFAGEVCVHTAPGAALTITVTYCNGLEAHNVDLQGTRYADSDGNYTWNWVPETTCPGTAVAQVTASGSGGSSDASAPFTVGP